MQIAPIGFNYSSNYSVRNTNASPAFGCNPNAVEGVILSKLADKCTYIDGCTHAKVLVDSIEAFTKKYHLPNDSVGTIIISNENLMKYFSKILKNPDTLKGKNGICIVAGDRPGPVTEMTNIYESRLCIDNGQLDLY